MSANIVTSSFFFSKCNSENVVLIVAHVISNFNFLRLMNRVVEFKKLNFIVGRCLLFIMHYMLPFVIAGGVVATICYSVFSKQVVYCTDSRGQEILSRQQCEARQLGLTQFFIHFDTIQNALLAYYVLVERSLWYDILPIILDSPGLHALYKLVAFGVVYILAGFVTFVLRGVTLSICYVSLEKFASVRMDKKIALTRPQVEWIQTEEMLSDVELLRKLPNAKLGLSKWCLAVKESTHWAVIYYTVIIAGFLFNISQ